jgi:hypothetical protein
MIPSEPGADATQPRSAPAADSTPAPRRSKRRWLAALLATLYLEAGFFLAAFPWTRFAAGFAAFRPSWRPYWENAFVRCGISALGLVNVYLACVEIVGLRRFRARLGAAPVRRLPH